MRVIAGTAKGRRLQAPPGTFTRPTSDRVKEALFSMLGPRLRAARVLDLYAGSGALGIEALSRGASTATFVERDARAVAALRTNLERTGLTGPATVVGRDALAAVRSGLSGAPFDLVLADPPYALEPELLARMLDGLVELLADGASVVVELGRRAPSPAWPARLSPRPPRRYGDTLLHEARLQPEGGS